MTFAPQRVPLVFSVAVFATALAGVSAMELLYAHDYLRID
jgi:hypothetical protein